MLGIYMLVICMLMIGISATTSRSPIDASETSTVVEENADVKEQDTSAVTGTESDETETITEDEEDKESEKPEENTFPAADNNAIF